MLGLGLGFDLSAIAIELYHRVTPKRNRTLGIVLCKMAFLLCMVEYTFIPPII